MVLSSQRRFESLEADMKVRVGNRFYRIAMQEATKSLAEAVDESLKDVLKQRPGTMTFATRWREENGDNPCVQNRNGSESAGNQEEHVV